jgi:hypothetical protein
MLLIADHFKVGTCMIIVFRLRYHHQAETLSHDVVEAENEVTLLRRPRLFYHFSEPRRPDAILQHEQKVIRSCSSCM